MLLCLWFLRFPSVQGGQEGAYSVPVLVLRDLSELHIAAHEAALAEGQHQIQLVHIFFSVALGDLGLLIQALVGHHGLAVQGQKGFCNLGIPFKIGLLEKEEHAGIDPKDLGFHGRKTSVEREKVRFPASEFVFDGQEHIAGAVLVEKGIGTQLAAEIVEEESLADAGSSYDLIGACVSVAVLCKNGQGTVDDAVLFGFVQVKKSFIHIAPAIVIFNKASG